MTRYESSLSLTAVGDVMPGVSSIEAHATGRTIPRRIRAEPDSIFEAIRADLATGDLLLGTLECPLTDSFPQDDSGTIPFLLGPERAADSLVHAGFDCLSLASNHMLDHGKLTVERTLEILQERDINFVGDPLDKEVKKVYRTNDRTVAIGGFNLCGQGRQHRRDELFSFVERLSEADIIILLLHWGWGFEHLASPSDSQVTLGHDLIDAGADIILGSHSHVFQPVERYKGGVIAYSLGNFLFDMWRSENRKTGVLQLVHDRTGEFDISIEPVVIQDGALAPADHNLEELIRENPPEVPPDLGWRAKKQNMRHRYQIITHYLWYSTQLPVEYHVSNMKRWGQKLSSPREVIR